MIAQNDEISNEIDSHMRSADMEVASVNKFIDELHVSILLGILDFISNNV